MEQDNQDVFLIGYIGLGKMGFNMVEQLLEKGSGVVAYDTNREFVSNIVKKGGLGAGSIKELVQKLKWPRTIWIMVPYTVVQAILEELVPQLEKGDTIIDGGNSPYKESMNRSKELYNKGINFLDVGVSGGPYGARNGACLMIGGKLELYNKYTWLFDSLSVKNGYNYMGKSGAGHFVKMVHNGIEYGMMQALAEGFNIMKKSIFELNLLTIAELYNHGSVVESRLVAWLKDAYFKFGSDLMSAECCSGEVSHSGEGQWTIDEARELGVSASNIEGALEFRKKSAGNPSYTGQVLSAMRHQFGGHDASVK